MKIPTLYLLILFSILSCEGVKKPNPIDTIPEVIENKESEENTTNLSNKGIPVTIPGITKTVQGTKYTQLNSYLKDGLTIEVSMWDTDNIFTVSEMVSEDKKIMAEEDGFEILKEEKNGYIFKLNYEGVEDFGFYYALNKNDRIIEFGPAVIENKFYTFEQAFKMFETCKNAY